MSAQDVFNAYKATRSMKPLVQCITNFVSMDICANTLLAAGCSPAMAHTADEVEQFVAISSALYINPGTALDQTWQDGINRAIHAANELGKPWVLDPVGMGATEFRSNIIADLARLRPWCIRGNASEIIVLAKHVAPEAEGASSGAAGAAAGGPKGVDTAHSSDAAVGAAQRLAAELNCIVAVTGVVDYVVGPQGQTYAVANGHEMMTLVTATGCSLSALCAAFIAAAKPGSRDEAIPSLMLPVMAAVAVFALAGELAMRQPAGPDAQPSTCHGPGTLRQRLLDHLYVMGADVGEGRRAMRSLKITEPRGPVGTGKA